MIFRKILVAIAMLSVALSASAFTLINNIDGNVPGVIISNSGIILWGHSNSGLTESSGAYFKGNEHYLNYNTLDIYDGYIDGLRVSINNKDVPTSIPPSCSPQQITPEQYNKTFYINGRIISPTEIEITGCEFK